MMSTEQMNRLSDEAAADAERRNRHPWVPGSLLALKIEALGLAMRSMPNMGTYRPLHWEPVQLDDLALPASISRGRLHNLAAKEPYLMVDSSGLGARDEPALTVGELTDLIAANPLLGYSIVEVGQFQVVVGVFRKVDVATRDQSEDRMRWANIEGVAQAFANGARAKCHNADTDGHRYRLHATDIATRQDDGSVLFNWGGWYGPTTANHMNTILRAIGSRRHVSYAACRDAGEGTFIERGVN